MPNTPVGKNNAIENTYFGMKEPSIVPSIVKGVTH